MLLVLLCLACRNKDSDPDSGIIPEDTGDAPVDADGDGFYEEDDCDDTNSAVYPGASEIPYNGLDDDCDETTPDDDLEGDGFLEADDCDDLDAATNPDATEVCDGLDNDCNGEEDDAVGDLWYADVDRDGFGDASVSSQSCDGANGYVDDATDCDDTDASAYPGAEEVCDEADNDCNGEVDEGVQSIYWADTDGDGHGDPDSSTEGCDLPTGYSDNDNDCDDTDAQVSPNATEVCNEIDDDCDDAVDEDDAVDAGTWYTDADTDGYGDPDSSTESCSQPSGTVDNDDDCDDTDASLNPDTTWYLDHDSDGFGDADWTIASCEQPSGYISDSDDCDDLDEDVNPDAEEICNDIDDDCDGDIDDDDSDGPSSATYYADTDGDGLGDPDSSVETCEQPSGYVENSDDCDDTDATDTDSDGTQDCDDDDIDGDGLRNDWDADEYDDSVVRGPNEGLGGDGTGSVTSDETWADWALLDGGATAEDTSIEVDDGTPFASGDEVLVLSQQGEDAGTRQFVYVDSVSSNTLTIEPALEDDYSSSSVVLVQRVPHYDDFTLSSGATIDADDWAGGGGGVVVFRATGDVDITGTIDLGERGYRGGDGVTSNSSDPDQGESWNAEGSSGTTTANEGGGGSYPRRGDNGDSGGGGSYGDSGTAGTSYSGSEVCDPGDTYGDTELSEWYLGSGGGGGSPDTESDGTSSTNVTGDGGDGGGLVAIWAGTSLDVSGSILADGADGGDATSLEGEVGGGGAGSGGQVWLASPDLSLGGTISAIGGSGGTSCWHSGCPYGSAYGGDGGDGRIRLDYDELDGTAYPSGDTTVTEPDAGHSSAWED